MKVLLFLGFLAGLYLYGLLHVANVVLAQTQQLSSTYQYVANNADKIAAGGSVSAPQNATQSMINAIGPKQN